MDRLVKIVHTLAAHGEKVPAPVLARVLAGDFAAAVEMAEAFAEDARGGCALSAAGIAILGEKHQMISEAYAASPPPSRPVVDVACLQARVACLQREAVRLELTKKIRREAADARRRAGAEALAQVPPDRERVSPSPIEGSEDAEALFALEERGVRVRFAGEEAFVKRLVGHAMLGELLRRPHVAVPALELAGRADIVAADSDGRAPRPAKRGEDPGARLLEDRLASLEATGKGEGGEAAAIREELEAARAGALKTPATAARIAVKQAIGRAIRTLPDSLRAHLCAKTVKTGAFCSYRPAAPAPAWTVSLGD